MGLDLVRKELDNYDNMIKNMITLRMSLIPIVADIKIKNNLPLFQGKREEQIYMNIEKFANENGVDNELLKNVYRLIIGNALNIEEDISEDSSTSVINKDIDKVVLENVKSEFEKLDNIIEKEIPEIIEKIKKECGDMKLNQIATLYYNKKVDN